MADIYKERGGADYATEFYTQRGNIGQQLLREAPYERQAMAVEKQAQKLYSTGLEVEWQNTANELLNNPDLAKNPKGLQEELKKVTNDMAKTIEDKDVKLDFIVNSEIKGQAYVTKAIETKKRNDYRIAKSLTFQGIDEDTDTIGLSFSTLLGGEFNPDNVAIYGKAMFDVNNKINALNEDGTFMFTDEQRKSKQKAIDKAHYIALRGNLNGMPAYQLKTYLEDLSNDNINVPVGIDKDKQVVFKNLQDIVSQETYEKFKEYAGMIAKRKMSISKSGIVSDDDEAFALAEEQVTNAIMIENEITNIRDLKKDKPVERVLRNLELQDNIQNIGVGGLSETDYKRFRKQTTLDLMQAIKNDSDVFDDAWIRESAMSIGLQAMKNDGKIGGESWSDDMSVVMIRDFYSMAKEQGLDLRATDSASRDKAKSLASKAISNTIERVSGGYGREYNSIFLNGQKVSKKMIIEDQPEYNNQDYIIDNGKKIYNETGIEVDI